MPLGFAVMLWTAGVPLGGQPGIAPVLSLSAAELARTNRIMTRGQPAVARPGPPLPDPPPAARLPDAPVDLALLIGDRRGSGQVEMGALGGGRADAPGLVHIGIGLDF